MAEQTRTLRLWLDGRPLFIRSDEDVETFRQRMHGAMFRREVEQLHFPNGDRVTVAWANVTVAAVREAREGEAEAVSA